MKNNKEFYASLLASALISHGTPTKSREEELMEKALSSGRTIEAAKLDVNMILNLASAINILIDRIVSEENSSSSYDAN